MGKKLVIAVGGTGGHVYPAEALFHQIKERFPDIQCLFVGGGLGKNNYFNRKECPFVEVSCGNFLGKNPLKWMVGGYRISCGLMKSLLILRSFQPDLVIGFGSFYTLPTLLAAKCLKVPIVLHEADAYPGKVNRLLSNYVECTAVHFREAAAHLSGKSVEVHVALRKGYSLQAISKEKAMAYFGLNPKKTTLLVFGGSQGAQTLNNLCSQAILKYQGFSSDFQVMHFTGNESLAESIKQLYEAEAILAYVKPFEKRMDLAWACADLVICRAGAGTIAEQTEYEVPAIFIPYPYAAGDHQAKNGECIVKEGGAIMFREANLTIEQLMKAMEALFDKQCAKEMRVKIRQRKLRRAQRDFCAYLEEFLQNS